jgi:hypothetical protein
MELENEFPKRGEEEVSDFIRKKELKEAKEEGRREEHLKFCGWCRMGQECPWK